MARYYFLAVGVAIPESLESACSRSSSRVESLGRNRCFVRKDELHRPMMDRGRT